jgi:hypothetical protein
MLPPTRSVISYLSPEQRVAAAPLLLQALHTVRRERLLMAEIDYRVLKNRERFRP